MVKPILSQNIAKCTVLYPSLSEIKLVNSDSVYYVGLRIFGLKEMPSEICNLKNLTCLDLRPFYLNDEGLKDSLNPEEKKLLRKSRRQNKLYGTPFPPYRNNKIFFIPSCFYQLKNLRLLEIGGIEFNLDLYDSLNKYMPDLVIEPSRVEFIEMRNKRQSFNENKLKMFFAYKRERRLEKK